MKIVSKNYEMRVNQINEKKFRLKLIDTSQTNGIVYETISTVIPSTLDLIHSYNRKIGVN